MPLAEVRDALERVLIRWGCPGHIKVDNGRPLGDPGSDLPPVLALWLIGLGVGLIWNRPGQPTDNAKVERMQAVTAAWSEPRQCADAEVLGAHLDHAAYLQRSRYRVRRLRHRTREAAFPDLLSGGRRYEAAGFDVGRVLAFLGGGTWVRRVSKRGQVHFYGQRWFLGACHRRRRVWIRLDLATRQWVALDEAGVELKRFGSSFLSGAAICELSLNQRAGKT